MYAASHFYIYSASPSCNYCMAAHSGLAKMIGMSEEDVEALRNSTPMSDNKLQALRHFTQQMVRQGAWVKIMTLKR